MRDITWSKADLHIHTTHSDGLATVPELLEYVATKTDLKVIAITDHDNFVGAKQAAKLGPQFGIEVVQGEEVSTADGHLLALFIHKHLPPGRPVAETLAAIHAQGGLGVAPHPFDHSVPSLGCGNASAQFNELPFDGLEGFNGGVLWQQRRCNKAARAVAAQINLPTVGCSDAHSLETVGKGFTWFHGSTANDLYRAIQTKNARNIQWSGEYWSVADYAKICLHSAQQIGAFAYLRWVLSMSGQTSQQVLATK